MAISVLTNVSVKVNGVDLSDHVSKVTIEDNRDTVDITAMGATNKTVTKGLGDAKVTADFFNDFAAGSVYATLQPLIGSSTPVPVELIPNKSVAVSATNPRITMQALLFSFNALDGSVGDANSMSAEFQNAAQAGVTYATV